MHTYRIPILVGLFWVALLLAACGSSVFNSTATVVTGSGNIITQTEDFTDFNRLNVSHAFRVTVNRGAEYSVMLRVDDNLVDYLAVEQNGSTVKIGIKNNYNVQNGTLEAEITMPELKRLDLSGASSATVNGFESEAALDVRLSGASTLTGQLSAGDVHFDVSGASHLNLDGTGSNLNGNASGASVIDFEHFNIEDANIDLSGASTGMVNFSGVLDVKASGASQVFYDGAGTLGSIDTSGASNVMRQPQ